MPEQATIDRQLENDFLSVFLAIPIPNVYRAVEGVEKILPCALVGARVTGEDLSFKLDGRVANTMELRVTGRVSTAAENSAATLENFSRTLKGAVESATGVTGWNFLKLEYEGDERAAEGAHREITHIWNVVAHAQAV